MKKISVLFAAVLCLLVLSGCGCKHEWQDATCTTPKLCKLCGEGEGEPLGHDWQEATCTTVKSCRRCGRTEGDPLGHVWQDASCTEPKTCTVCRTKLGAALGHRWQEATTDAPKTCAVCRETEGAAIETDPRFSSEATEELWGRWEAVLNLTEDDLDVDHYNGTLEATYWIEFTNTGKAAAGFTLKNEKAFREAYAEYCADLVYEAAALGRADQEEADATAKALLDMTVEEYVLVSQKEKTADELVEQLLDASDYAGNWAGDLFYYIQDGKLYIDRGWEEKMAQVNYEFIGTTLMLYDVLEFKKA